MTTRERFFNAMRRQGDSYIPFEFTLCPSLHEEFKKRTGESDYVEYYNFPARTCWLESTRENGIFAEYYQDSPDVVGIDDWGVGHRKGTMAHFTEMQHPMKDFQTLEEFEGYPYPNAVQDYNWEPVSDRIKAIKNRDLISVAGMETTIFERAWYMRGMDQFMVDMILNPDLATYHLDRITEIKCEWARRYAAADVDVMRLGDDVSTQLDMMMSPGLWRQFIKPRLEKVIKAAKEMKPDIMIFYHGDGNLQKVIPDLIEIGVEILNPIQPECMDPVEVKRKYGDRLSFWGTIGTQTTMPFGTPDEVRRICQTMIEKVGKGGGLFLAPTHVLEPEVPWENIQAFIDTVKEYNDR